MKKDSLTKHIWTNSRWLLFFCFLFLPVFVGIAALISGRWGVDFTITLGVAALIAIGSCVGDWIRWRRL